MSETFDVAIVGAGLGTIFDANEEFVLYLDGVGQCSYSYAGAPP